MRHTLICLWLVALTAACSSKTFEPLAPSYFEAPKTGAVGSFAAAGSTPRLAMTLEGHEDNVNALAFTPDGKYLASVGYGDYQLCLWRLVDGQRADRKKTEHRVRGLCVLPDGSAVLTGDVYGWLTYWPVKDGRLGSPEAVQTSLKDEGGISAVALSGNGRVLVAVGWNKPVLVWDVAERKELRAIAPAAPLGAVAISWDGRLVAVGGQGNTFRLFDLSRGTEGSHAVTKVEAASSVTALAFSPDGKYLATGHNETTFSVWETASMKELHNHFISNAAVMGAAFSSDGKSLATIQHGTGVYLWDPATRAIQGILEEKGGPVESVAWSPDGRTLAAGTKSKAIRLWR